MNRYATSMDEISECALRTYDLIAEYLSDRQVQTMFEVKEE